MKVSRQQWQYGVLNLLELDQQEATDLLNEAGVDGWELVSVLGHGGVVATAYLKRPRDFIEDIGEALDR